MNEQRNFKIQELAFNYLENFKEETFVLRKYIFLISSIFFFTCFICQTTVCQTIMFDDFDYSGVNDNQLSSFNQWNIIDGVSGPPEGAIYRKSNVDFIVDPNNPINKLMTLKTTANGQTGATTQSRIETLGFEYFEGTYAARVYLTDEAFYSQDANIQTFYTIVSSALAQDGTKYSELDIIEYMASDKWGVSPNNRIGYTTSYHKYIAVPWTAWKTYDTQQKSLEGWHTFVATCTDGVNIRYYMDSILIAIHSVTDNTVQEGLSVYPRSNMHVAFANWIWNGVLGDNNAIRENTFMVDWVLYYKNQSLSPIQVDNLVNSYRSEGLKRRNLLGQTYYGIVNPPANGEAIFFQDCNFGGYSVSLSEGSYTLNQLQEKGITNDDISSIKVKNGYELILYQDDNFAGPSLIKATNDTCLVDDNFNDNMSSAVVSKVTSSWSTLIEAEDFVAQSGTQTEACSEGGLNVGWIDADDWLVWDVNIPNSGSYTVKYRVASPNTEGMLQLEKAGGSLVYGALNIPNTGGWQNWTTVQHTVNLEAGAQQIAIKALAGGWNINWLRVASTANKEILAPKHKRDKDLIVYPIPTSEVLILKGVQAGSFVGIYDVKGKLILETKINEKEDTVTLDVGDLKPGLYILKDFRTGESIRFTKQ